MVWLCGQFYTFCTRTHTQTNVFTKPDTNTLPGTWEGSKQALRPELWPVATTCLGQESLFWITQLTFLKWFWFIKLGYACLQPPQSIEVGHWLQFNTAFSIMSQHTTDQYAVRCNYTGHSGGNWSLLRGYSCLVGSIVLGWVCFFDVIFPPYVLLRGREWENCTARLSYELA